jgi:hypothetical protein
MSPEKKIKLVFSHKSYSENKVRIKQIIKKYGMYWDDKKSGWVNEATGDGVYIDRSVMEMILSDSFSRDMPMTLYIDSKDPSFINEMKEKCGAFGGEFSDASDISHKVSHHIEHKAVKKPEVSMKKPGVFRGLNVYDSRGCNTHEFMEKAYIDLKDISGRWERRKSVLLNECSRIGFEKDSIEKFLQREEIAFRKANACWVTGVFPSSSKIKDIDAEIATDE